MKLVIFPAVLNRMEEDTVCLFPQGAPGTVGPPGPKGLKGDSRAITTKGQSLGAKSPWTHSRSVAALV